MRNKLVVLLMLAMGILTSCTSVTTSTTTKPAPVPVTAIGIIVLCNAGAASGLNTAAIVVGNLQPNPIVEIPVVVDPGNTPAQVCQSIRTAATSAGWTTDLSDPNSTGLLIYGPSDKIEIKCKNITLQLKTFGGGQTGPPTDCAPIQTTRVLKRDPPPIVEPCPPSSPCQRIEINTPNGVDGTVSVFLSPLGLETLIQRNAQNLLSANLPGNLTNTVDVGPVQYQKGRVTIQHVNIDGVVGLCGVSSKPPCMPLPTSTLTVDLGGIYEKDKYVYNLTPWPPGYKEKGWLTIGTFALPVGIAFGVDSQLALPLQNLQVISTATTATITTSVIFPGSKIPIAINNAQTIAIPLVNATTLSQYPFLNTLSIKSLAVTQINVFQIVVSGTFGASPATSHHR